jgi:hypothetical protein
MVVETTSRGQEAGVLGQRISPPVNVQLCFAFWKEDREELLAEGRPRQQW